MFHYSRILFALAAPLLLSACLLTPGKFTSTLDIRADRSFTFAYKGEVIAFDMGKEMGKGMMSDPAPEENKESLEKNGTTNSMFTPIAFAEGDEPKGDAPGLGDAADTETKMKAMAEALSKESGYKSVQYAGNSKFLIDYEIHGTLDHGFVYPFNIDAEIVFPFIAIELRGRDIVRVKAPGYANEDDKKGGMGMPPAKESTLDGTFTLTTNAEIVSQNNEAGATPAPNGRKIMWKATPLTKDAPMAVLRVAPLP